MSADDNNIGASYNPWLIFASEKDAKDCERDLEINWDNSDAWGDDWDAHFEDDLP